MACLTPLNLKTWTHLIHHYTSNLFIQQFLEVAENHAHFIDETSVDTMRKQMEKSKKYFINFEKKFQSSWHNIPVWVTPAGSGHWPIPEYKGYSLIIPMRRQTSESNSILSVQSRKWFAGEMMKILNFHSEQKMCYKIRRRFYFLFEMTLQTK